MKKLFLLSIIWLIGNELLFADNLISVLPSPDVVITIKLNLHSKRLECLYGFGFCKISINVTIEDNLKSADESIAATASFNSRNQLIIKIDESDLYKYDHGNSTKYFEGQKSVTLDSSYELSEEVLGALGHPQPLTIKEGTYPVNYNQGIYTVIIDMH